MAEGMRQKRIWKVHFPESGSAQYQFWEIAQPRIVFSCGNRGFCHGLKIAIFTVITGALANVK
jgi:hypothetical protein